MFDLSGLSLPFDDQNATAWARQVAAAREWEYRPSDPGLLYRFRRVLGAPDQPRNPGSAFLRELNPLTDFKQLFTHPGPTDGNSFGHRLENVLIGRHRGRQCAVFQYGWSSVTDGDDPADRAGGTWCGVALHLGYRAPDLAVLPSNDTWTLATPPGARTQVGHPAVDAYYQVTTAVPAFAVDLLASPVGDLLAQRVIGFHLAEESAIILKPGYLHRFPLDRALDDLSDVADRVPDAVVTRLRGDAG